MDHYQIGGRASHGLPRALAYAAELAVLPVHRHDGGLPQADALAADIQQRGIRAQINGYVPFDQIIQSHACHLSVIQSKGKLSHPDGRPPPPR